MLGSQDFYVSKRLFDLTSIRKLYSGTLHCSEHSIALEILTLYVENGIINFPRFAMVLDFHSNEEHVFLLFIVASFLFIALFLCIKNGFKFEIFIFSIK